VGPTQLEIILSDSVIILSSILDILKYTI